MACIHIRIVVRFLVLLFVAGLGLQPAHAQQYDPSFDRPEQISDNPNADFAPRIATSGGHVYVVWTNEEPAVVFRKSADGGKTFDFQRILAAGGGANTHIRADVAASGNNVQVVFAAQNVASLSCQDILLYSSADNGDSLPILPTSPTAVLSNDLCLLGGHQSENPRVAVSGTKVYVVWAEVFNPVPAKNGIWLAISRDNAPGFDVRQIATPTGAAVAFGSRGGSTPAIAASKDNVYIAWDDEAADPAVGRAIFVARSTSRGQTFSILQPVSLPTVRAGSPEIAASGANAYLAWNGHLAGDAVAGNTPSVIRTFFSKSSEFGASFSPPQDVSGPVSFSLSGGLGLAAFSQTVLVAWTGPGTPQQIFLKASANAGQGFGPATNPGTNPGFVPDTLLPAVAISDFGRFIAWTGVSSPPTVPNTLGNLDVFFRASADTDGDGLPDSWERDGIDVDGDGVIDFRLPCTADPDTGESVCPDPLHKDIYVEIDYMHFHKPLDEAMKNVVRAFKNAPVHNPDGKTGVNLHLEIDEELPHEDTVLSTRFQEIKEGTPGPEGTVPSDSHFGQVSQRASFQTIAAKRLAYHYALFAHQFAKVDTKTGTVQPQNGIEGIGEVGGNDLLVSLGNPGFAKQPTVVTLAGQPPVFKTVMHEAGSQEQQAETFMHELGHNLGLLDGGGDPVTCKPNYFSVMNYSVGSVDFVGTRPLDYSREKLDTLNEMNLNEIVGFTANGVPLTFDNPTFSNPSLFPSPLLLTIFGPAPVKFAFAGPIPPLGGAIDWNGNKHIDPSAVQSDLNNLVDPNSAIDPKDQACPGTGDELTGFNDWESLRYNFRDSGLLANFQQPELRELTMTDRRSFRLLNLDGIDNAIQGLPDVAFDESQLAAQRRADFHSSLITSSASVAALIASDKLRDALASLGTVRARMDGSNGAQGGDDWIIDPAAQQALLTRVDNFAVTLQKNLDFAGEPPVANAGRDQAVETGTVVKLSGLRSFDPAGVELSFAWTQIGGDLVALSSNASPAVSFTAPHVVAPTVLTFQLVVSAGDRISSPTFVNVTVNPMPKPANRPPVANAGSDQAVNPGATVVLDGSASADPDGDQLNFLWTQTAGSVVTLQGANTASPSFTAPAVTAQTVLIFELRVSDGKITSTPALVTVTILTPSVPILTSPVQVFDFAARRADSAQDMRIAVLQPNVYAAWRADVATPLGPRETTVFFSSSKNNGLTFSEPIVLGKVRSSIEGIFSLQLAAAGNNVYVAWHRSVPVLSSTTNEEVDIVASHDGGVTFGDTVVLALGADRVSGVGKVSSLDLAALEDRVFVLTQTAQVSSDCPETTLEAETEGRAVRCLLLLGSGDAGRTFAAPVKLGFVAQVGFFGGSDPKLAISGSNVYIAWPGTDQPDLASIGAFQSDAFGVFFRKSTDQGASFGDLVKVTTRPVFFDHRIFRGISASGSNVYVLWKRKDDSAVATKNLLVRASSDSGATFGAEFLLTNHVSEYYATPTP